MNEQSILIIANGAAYGNESLFNALRVAIGLKEKRTHCQLNLFLMSDAVVAALANQKPHDGYSLQQMLDILLAQDVAILLCKTCADARGISELPLINGVNIGTLSDLANWIFQADKVLTF